VAFSKNDNLVIAQMVEKGRELAGDFPKDWETWWTTHMNWESGPEDVDYIDFYLAMTREE